MWLLAGPLEGQSVLLACKPFPAPMFVVVVVCAARECADTHMHVEAGGLFSAVCSFLLASIPGIQLRLSGSYGKCCYLLTRLIGPQFLILAGLKSRCSQSEASLHFLELSFWRLSFPHSLSCTLSISCPPIFSFLSTFILQRSMLVLAS